MGPIGGGGKSRADRLILARAPPPDPAGSRPRRGVDVTDEERGGRLRGLAQEMAASYRDLAGLNSPGREHLPSPESIGYLAEELLALIFPGYHGAPVPPGADLELQLGGRLDDVCRRLSGVLAEILRFCHRQGSRCEELWVMSPAAGDAGVDGYDAAARRLALDYLQQLPGIRRLAEGDVRAAFEGDPAAGSWEEVILCYPGVLAVAVHRLAHPLHGLGVPLLPRMMSEWAHRQTGIDIHPGAVIGASFFIDHGTGVVIGETTRIGAGVKVYQGVTLGALSFPRNTDGSLVKGGRRHPTIGDGVTIYANATILGGDTEVGAGAVIGGGTWIIASVPPGARIVK